jgi:hypothetical protein
MTSAASPTGTVASPSPENARQLSRPAPDLAWSRALVEADTGPAGGMADWTAPQDAPMQGLTASGETIMRQSAVAMTIGLVSPVVASASIQPAYGTPMPAASVIRPDSSAGETKASLRTAASPPKTGARPAAAQAESGVSASLPVALPAQNAVPATAETPIAALQAMVQAQLGGAVAVAASAAVTMLSGQASVPPGTPPAGPGMPVPSDDLVAHAPMPGRVGGPQLTGLDLPAAMAEAEVVPADDLVPTAPPAGRTGIVQLTGLEGPEGSAEPEEAPPAEPDRVAVTPQASEGETVSAEHAPVRLYAEWTEQGVKVWLGADADQLQNLPVLAQQVQQWLGGQGERLLSLVCNGQEVATEAETGADFSNSQSGEGWAGRPLPRPASLSERF